MEIITGLLIVNILILIAGIFYITRQNKVKIDRWLEVMVDRISLENIHLTDCFSKEVIELYLDVLKDTNKFSLTKHTLDKAGSKMRIWATNDWDSRRFYTQEKELETECKRLNDNLTHWDKILLDKLVTSFRDRQDKLVTKFFL